MVVSLSSTSGDPKLGLSLGYWAGRPPVDAASAVLRAEQLRFDSVWTAETYGSDALTPLAWWGAQTTHVRLGTSVVQMAARAPAATAMAAITMDHLSNGRFVLGLGASGPQVVEGWYGAPYESPLSRTREYVQIVRAILARERPVEFNGRHYELPYVGEGSLGLGKPLRANVRPLRNRMPIFLGAEGPRNIALAAEICDGWIPLFFSPKQDNWYRERLAEGFAACGDPAKSDRFEVAAMVPIVISPDVDESADSVRRWLALYIGGMGARGMNFHLDVFGRMGWSDVALKVQHLYLEGRKEEASAAIPIEMVEDVALVGPADKIREDLDRWRSTCITTFLVDVHPGQLDVVAGVFGL